jgi:integrase
MTRPAELATTRWTDIDFDRRIWSIPPERMKKRRPHTIPLTEQALALSDRAGERSLSSGNRFATNVTRTGVIQKFRELWFVQLFKVLSQK